MGKRNIPSLSQKIGLTLFGIIIFIVSLEAVLRLAGFVLLSTQEYGNKMALRKKGAYRVMCIGESTTAKQYTRFLEEILNRRSAKIKFSVIDKGLRATNTTVILSQVEDNINQYHPDMVVAMMGVNDYGGHMSYEPSANSKVNAFLRSSRVYKLFRLLWQRTIAKVNSVREKSLGFVSSFSVTWAAEIAPKPEQSPNNINDGSKVGEDAISVNQGYEYIKENKFSDAEAVLKKALKINPKNVNALEAMGEMYKNFDMLPQAEVFFKQVLALEPGNVDSWNNLGVIYKDETKNSLAEEAFKKSVTLKPDGYWGNMGLGLIYVNKEKFQDALVAFKKVIEIDPKGKWPYYWIVLCCRKLGCLPLAEEYLKKGISSDPKNPELYGGLAILYEETGKGGLAKFCRGKAKALRMEFYSPMTRNNYLKLKKILDDKKIRLVCVQYPLRSLEPLKKILGDQPGGIIFVDNDELFRVAVRKEGYSAYFEDMFAGDFGHCTQKGNRLLADNIAEQILRAVSP